MRKSIISVFILIGISLCFAQEVTIGSGSDNWSYPFHGFNFDARTQTIYYASEINTSGYITAMAFNLVSSSPIANFKIRLKHTSQSSYSAAVFDSDGWTVVYNGSWPAGSGWVKINFDYPFYYNSSSNLLVDVSFDRSGYSSSAYCRTTTAGVSRSLYAGSDSSIYDPQVWTLGGYGPAATASTKTPNIKLYIDAKTHWQSLGVMSFNIRYANNTEDDPCDNYTDVPAGCTPRRERILEMVRNASQTFGSGGPDIIGTQEVYDKRNQIFDMVNGLDDKWAWSGISEDGTMSVDNGHSYDVIFYKKNRFEGKNQGVFWLSDTPDIPSMSTGSSYYRIASWVTLHDKFTNRDYFVLNTHMDEDIEEQAYAIMNKLELLAGDLPIIIMGDLNTRVDQNSCKILTGQICPGPIELHDCFRDIYPVAQPCERSTSSWVGNIEGNRRIDHIFGTDDFICRGFTIERSRVLGRFPSDHYPVAATFYVPTNLLADLDNDSDVDMSDVSAFCDDWLLSGQTLTNSTINNGLLARWSFDSAVSGSHYNAYGINNGAADFNGFGDTVYNSSTLGSNMSNFTIAFWLKLDRMPYWTSVEYYMMNIVGNSSKSSGSIQLSMRDNHRLRLEVYSSSSAMETAYSSTTNTFVTNKWYHVAVLYGKNPNEVKYYINGQLDRTVTLTNQIACWIGPLGIGSYGNSSRFLDGTLDELRIYSRQLTEAEIEYLAAGAASPGSIMQKVPSPADFTENQGGQSIVNYSDFAEFTWNFQ